MSQNEYTKLPIDLDCPIGDLNINLNTHLGVKPGVRTGSLNKTLSSSRVCYCPATNRVLLTHLGAMGVGTMWMPAAGYEVGDLVYVQDEGAVRGDCLSGFSVPLRNTTNVDIRFVLCTEVVDHADE